ncbi:hypothetical protein [Bacterioplanoides sp.]|uniref:hypothetical protein n=1 Tax=Bacterioplanoides sp. TaxID=2066072 RepID=UPI003B5A2684
MFIVPGIVAVDDNPKELEQLKEGLFSAGLSCFPVVYDEVSGIDDVNFEECSGIRVVISDLNLTESQSVEAPQLVGPLGEMLKSLPLTGPYILCIWSKIEDKVAEVMELLESRYSNKINLPLRCVAISKTKFLTDPDGLKERLIEEISSSPLLNAIIKWEKKVTESANAAVDNLYRLSRPREEFTTVEKQGEAFDMLMSAIANESLGAKNALEEPSVAVESGLFPIVEDHLRSQKNNVSLWKDALTKVGGRISLDQEIKSTLNTFYSVEEVEDNFSRDSRGVFLELNLSYLSDKDNLEKFQKRFGNNITDIVNQEFIRPIGKKSKQEDKDNYSASFQNCVVGFLESSAACDYAQRKVKLPRYILGILIPEELKSFARFKFQDTYKEAHDGIYRLPIVNYKGKPYILKFSFKYQVGAQPEDHKWFGRPLLRLRDQVIASINSRNANYSSRLGVMSFHDDPVLEE